jgi:hypothetical protein
MRGGVAMLAVGMLAVGMLAVGISIALTACGSSLEGQSASPAPREGDELQARAWHDRVVRLEGEATWSASPCELTDRICSLASAEDLDEGTRVLCEDARARCQSARSATSACSCGA